MCKRVIKIIIYANKIIVHAGDSECNCNVEGMQFYLSCTCLGELSFGRRTKWSFERARCGDKKTHLRNLLIVHNGRI